MNRKLILSAALSGLMLTATAQTTVAPAIPRDRKIEKKVEALLKKMTLEEKIGQMTELTIDVITKRDEDVAVVQIHVVFFPYDIDCRRFAASLRNNLRKSVEAVDKLKLHLL